MPILPCSVPDCDRAVYVKKSALCMPHYNRRYYSGSVEFPDRQETCLHCAGPNPPKVKSNGPAPSYCSDDCRRKRARERSIESGAYAAALAKRREQIRPKSAIVCRCCSTEFLASRSDSKLCSKTCQQRWARANPKKLCTVAQCERASEAKGLCAMHWKRNRRAEGLIANEPWDERRKANHQRRRAQKLNLPADTIRPLDIYERDGWICSICSEPVARELAYPDPMSPSLDHVIPLAKGGHHTFQNTALAHWQCNVRKGDRVDA